MNLTGFSRRVVKWNLIRKVWLKWINLRQKQEDN